MNLLKNRVRLFVFHPLLIPVAMPGGSIGALGAGSELVNNYVSDRPLFTPSVGSSAFWSSVQMHPTQAQHALDAGMERAAQSTVGRLGNTPVGRFASFATAPVDPVAKRALDTGTRAPSFYRPGDLRRVQATPVQHAPARHNGTGGVQASGAGCRVACKLLFDGEFKFGRAPGHGGG